MINFPFSLEMTPFRLDNSMLAKGIGSRDRVSTNFAENDCPLNPAAKSPVKMVRINFMGVFILVEVFYK
jgi:hypothetical protein